MNKLFICFILLFCSSSFLSAQQRKIDSLENLLKTDQEDTNKVMHIVTVSYSYITRGKLSKGLNLANYGDSLSVKLKYTKGLSGIYNNLGIANSIKGNYPKAIEYFLKKMKIDEARGNIKNMVSVYGNLGQVYAELENYPTAIDYYKKSMQLAEKVKDTASILRSIVNIGYCYFNLKYYPLALTNFERALKLNEKSIKNQELEAVFLADISNTYLLQDKFNEAMDYAQRALEIDTKIDNKLSTSAAFGTIGAIYIKQKKYSEAESYLKKSLALSEANQDIKILKEDYDNLAIIYSKTGQWQKAYEYNLKSSDTKDSLYSKDRSKEIGKLEAKYEYGKDSAIQQVKYANQLAIKQAEAEKKTAESKTERTIIWLIASVTLVLVLIVVLVFQRMKGAEKQKLIAEQQKSWLELKALRTQMNPHFLYNTINSIQSFVLNNDTKASSDYLAQFAGLMRGVLENSRKDKITIAEEIEGLSGYLDFEAMRFPSRFHYTITVDETLDKNKTFLPPLLVQPYVENAIWHGLMHLKTAEGQLSINFEKEGSHIKCTIDDNGIGRKAAAEIKKQSVHKSVGLSIVAERMESMNKMYHWDMSSETIDKTDENGNPTGTKIVLMLPLILNSAVYA